MFFFIPFIVVAVIGFLIFILNVKHAARITKDITTTITSRSQHPHQHPHQRFPDQQKVGETHKTCQYCGSMVKANETTCGACGAKMTISKK